MKFKLTESLLLESISELTEAEFIEMFSESVGTCYESISMAMEVICEKLYYSFGLEAFYKGRFIYIDNRKVFEIEFSHEGVKCWAIYKIKTSRFPLLKKEYYPQDFFD